MPFRISERTGVSGHAGCGVEDLQLGGVHLVLYDERAVLDPPATEEPKPSMAALNTSALLETGGFKPTRIFVC
jgi:hypothetical protein